MWRALICNLLTTCYHLTQILRVYRPAVITRLIHWKVLEVCLFPPFPPPPNRFPDFCGHVSLWLDIPDKNKISRKPQYRKKQTAPVFKLFLKDL